MDLFAVEEQMPEEDISTHVSAERLASYLDGRLTPNERDGVLAHFAECPECRREMADSRNVIVRAPSTGVRPLARRALIPAIAALAAALAFVVASPMLRNLRGPGAAVRAPAGLVESESVPELTTVAPAEDAIFAREADAFVWRAASGDAEYRLTVTDATGGIVWSKSTTDTSVMVPNDLRLVRGSEYFWSVDALLDGGRSATTPAHRFSIR